MTNPYESPKSPPDSSDPGTVTGQDAGKYLHGFFSALLMTIVFTALFGFPLQMVLTTWLPESLKALAFLLSSPAVTGPLCALILWLRIGCHSSSIIKGIKCALSCLGICDDCLAEPFHRFNPPERERVEEVLRELGLRAQVHRL